MNTLIYQRALLPIGGLEHGQSYHLALHSQYSLPEQQPLNMCTKFVNTEWHAQKYQSILPRKLKEDNIRQTEWLLIPQAQRCKAGCLPATIHLIFLPVKWMSLMQCALTCCTTYSTRQVLKLFASHEVAVPKMATVHDWSILL